MARKRWVYINGEAIPVTDDVQPEPRHYIMPDLKPYKSMATGEIIEGRRQHRDMLKATNCIEIGNEKQTSRPMTPPPGLRETLIQVAQDKLRYR
jgi:hypothetical protein